MINKAAHRNVIQKIVGAFASDNSAGNFWTKLAHGFTASMLESEHAEIRYEESRGVGIRIEQLNKSFNGNHVLKDVDLEIKAGETFSLIGPSGTGKSVLLKHIVKLEKPDSGRILIDGHDIQSGEVPDRNYRYSIVFQSSALFNSLTVGENVGLWLREKRVCGEARIRRIINEKLALVGLDDKDRDAYLRAIRGDEEAGGDCPLPGHESRPDPV